MKVNNQLLRDIERLPSEIGTLFLKKIVKDYYHVEGIIRYSPSKGRTDAFKVLLKIHASYPYTTPILYETGSRYEHIDSRHFNSDGSCCVEMEAILNRATRFGLPLDRYVGHFAIPFFANQIYFDTHGEFLTEHPHGNKGIKAHITTILQTDDPVELKLIFDQIRQRVKRGRNQPCFCGSGLKYKRCHLRKVGTLLSYYKREELLRIIG
jgi:hypothetical protein